MFKVRDGPLESQEEEEEEACSSGLERETHRETQRDGDRKRQK